MHDLPPPGARHVPALRNCTARATMVQWPMIGSAMKLLGYRFSVYTRVVRLLFAEKGLSFAYEEVNPFQAELAEGFRRLAPFGRVPVLVHGDFTLYETAAIARYLEARFPDPPLTPADPRALARMQQVIGILDAYGYRALVRQVFAHAVFRPLEGLESSAEEIRQGLAASRRVLAALEAIAREGLLLDGESITLADLHLFPMVDYFRLARDGEALLQKHPSLLAWWKKVSRRPSAQQTRPDLSQVPCQPPRPETPHA